MVGWFACFHGWYMINHSLTNMQPWNIYLRMEQGTCSIEHGAWIMDHGAWSMEHGAWSMEHGAWSMEHEAWSMDHWAWSMEHAEYRGVLPESFSSSIHGLAMFWSYSNVLAMLSYRSILMFWRLGLEKLTSLVWKWGIKGLQRKRCGEER